MENTFFQEIGQIFDPSLFYSIEAGAMANAGSTQEFARAMDSCGLYEEAEYADYTIEELIEQTRKVLERAEVGQHIEVDMGIAILSAKVAISSVTYDAGDGYTVPPTYEQTLRLEEVEIVEEDGTHRVGEEQTMEKIIF